MTSESGVLEIGLGQQGNLKANQNVRPHPQNAVANQRIVDARLRWRALPNLSWSECQSAQVYECLNLTRQPPNRFEIDSLSRISVCSGGPVNNSWVPVGPKENYTSWTPASNAWQPSGGGDDWTGPNNPVISWSVFHDCCQFESVGEATDKNNLSIFWKCE